jgi:hypothetical protein
MRPRPPPVIHYERPEEGVSGTRLGRLPLAPARDVFSVDYWAPGGPWPG